MQGDTMAGLDDKKRVDLIVSYYLSRCDVKAVKALGYKNSQRHFIESGI